MIKRLSQPFPMAIFPGPATAWTAAEIRAAGMVGYPLAATAPAVPTPAPAAEEAPVAIRVPSIRVPMVYQDLLRGWMEPWQGRVLESRKKRALKAVAPYLETAVFDKIRMREKVFCRMQLLKATNREMLKAKELLTGQGILNTAMPDKLRFGWDRRLLIDQMDQWLGIQ